MRNHAETVYRLFARSFVLLVLLVSTAASIAAAIQGHDITATYPIRYQNGDYTGAGAEHSAGSGVTYWPGQDSYLVLDNTSGTYSGSTGPRVIEFNKSHSKVRDLVLVGFKDPEDIHWISGNTFVISQEYNTGPGSVDELVVIDLPTGGTSVNINTATRRLTLGGYFSTTSNKGIEALAVIGSTFYFTTEYAPVGGSPPTWSVWSVPNSGNGAVTPSVAFNLPSLLSSRATDMSGMASDGTDLWLLSDEGDGSAPRGRILKVTTGGTLLADYELPAFSGGGGWLQAEGIEIFTDPADGLMKIILTGEGADTNGVASGMDCMILGERAGAWFAKTDPNTLGDWQGVYGADGYVVFGDSTSYPGYASGISYSGDVNNSTWNGSPTETRTLQRDTSGRIAAIRHTLNGTDYTIDLPLTDGLVHHVAFYFLDFDNLGRHERIDVLDEDNNVIDTRAVHSFYGGKWLNWYFRGHVKIKISMANEWNAGVSGIFFDTITGHYGDTVWMEDAIPTGATAYAQEDGWNWVSTSPTPNTGSTSHRSALAAGAHQHFFMGASQPLLISPDDVLYAYVNIVNAATGTGQELDEIMLQFNDSLNWEHRPYWGDNLMGGDDSAGPLGRTEMSSSLPSPAATWILLEVPAYKVGMVNRSMNGLAFTHYGGQIAWDRFGKKKLADTDDDGLPDAWEMEYFGSLSQTKSGDYDSDGVSNWLELLQNSNPAVDDTDGDGWDDAQEYHYGTFAYHRDYDRDEVLDPDEVASYANPELYDTDNDGLSDYEEIFVYFTNPFFADSDEDGLSDLDEVYWPTDPWNPDSDGDGYSDGDEVWIHGTNPLDYFDHP